MRLWYSLFCGFWRSHLQLQRPKLDALLNNPNLWTLSQVDFEKLPETRGFYLDFRGPMIPRRRATKEKLFWAPCGGSDRPL